MKVGLDHDIDNQNYQGLFVGSDCFADSINDFKLLVSARVTIFHAPT